MVGALWLAVAFQPFASAALPDIDTPCEVVKFIALSSVVYVWLPEKYASSDVAMLRRSDFSDARYAFSFVLANFGIAIAARMPIMTTTIRSSIRVKPLRIRDMWISCTGC